jgi:hypothetical protein
MFLIFLMFLMFLWWILVNTDELIGSYSLLVQSWGILYVRSCHLQTVMVDFLLSTWMAFVSSSFLIAWLGLPEQK